MIMKKNIIIAALIGIICFSFTACKSNDNATYDVATSDVTTNDVNISIIPPVKIQVYDKNGFPPSHCKSPVYPPVPALVHKNP